MNNLHFERVINLAANDTKKGSRVAAKLFYRILRKKGFSENQIIDISTNLLSCLIDSLNGYEKKVENAKERKKKMPKEDVQEKGISAKKTFTSVRSKYDSYDSTHYHGFL